MLYVADRSTFESLGATQQAEAEAEAAGRGHDGKVSSHIVCHRPPSFTCCPYSLALSVWLDLSSLTNSIEKRASLPLRGQVVGF